jgi:tetratricopeptide (TPR) repeat protein
VTGQALRGNQNVQIQHVDGSYISVVYEGAPPRRLPLQPAVVPVAPAAQSPARMVRARSGIVPFAAREQLRDDLLRWVHEPVALSGCLIGGRGGSGKTRLGVELCEQTSQDDWLAGLLAASADAEGLEALAQTPTARLVIVDYAESRLEQLDLLLPILADSASLASPVRIVLLVRDAPRRTDDWAEALRNHTDELDAVLDRFQTHVLEDAPLDDDQRAVLYAAAASAFAERADPPVEQIAEAPALDDPLFETPLLVVTAAYLGVHDAGGLPTSRQALLDELLQHERRYWRAAARARRVAADPEVLTRVVALGTLTAARSEAEACDLLRLLPDLADAPAERLGSLARLTRSLYPGPTWWNPLEPDLLGEQLVAETFTSMPELLTAAVSRPDPAALVHPLDVYARAAPYHPELAQVLSVVLSATLPELCRTAVRQAALTASTTQPLGQTTLAAALDRLLQVLPVAADALQQAEALMPRRPDVILSPLALTLTDMLIQAIRTGRGNDRNREVVLAGLLNNLAIRLGDMGRQRDGAETIEEAVTIHRRLAAIDPATHDPNLAMSLNNLANRLQGIGRHADGLEASTEATEIYQRLVEEDPDAYEPDLAMSLNNLANHVGDVGRDRDGLEPIETSVEIQRRLAAADPATYEPPLAASLNNLAICLGDADRHEDGLAASAEATDIYRRLAADNPSAYEPDVALSLNNLAVRLGQANLREEELAANEEAVEIHRRLVRSNPGAYEPRLAACLANCARCLGSAGRHADALTATDEAIEIRTRLSPDNDSLLAPLAAALLLRSLLLTKLERPQEAAQAEREAKEIAERAGRPLDG